MDYVFLIVGSAIVISCIYFIISPFFNNEKMVLAEGNEEEMPLEMIYAAVNELEMDYLMKKITKEDFESMKNRYQSLAASYMKIESNERSSHSKGNKTNDVIEREILKELNKLRKQKGQMEG
ncbi:hypothetical protein [Cytobacillus dafuensis]|uniref:Uncharacterized protein n=1 Tax=Cytobacillus dafuensis TaxID=1742359 RepID=A0A5B8Z821_CYTDA|nr:hypothetical protein [Cytobacillus dafuensis]QED49031.1 hypothetical protein FSZ17_18120 [Cytobacillus dafuensis]